MEELLLSKETRSNSPANSSGYSNVYIHNLSCWDARGLWNLETDSSGDNPALTPGGWDTFLCGDWLAVLPGNRLALCLGLGKRDTDAFLYWVSCALLCGEVATQLPGSRHT